MHTRFLSKELGTEPRFPPLLSALYKELTCTDYNCCGERMPNYIMLLSTFLFLISTVPLGGTQQKIMTFTPLLLYTLMSSFIEWCRWDLQAFPHLILIRDKKMDVNVQNARSTKNRCLFIPVIASLKLMELCQGRTCPQSIGQLAGSSKAWWEWVWGNS